MTLPKFMKAMEFSFKAMRILFIKSQIETMKLDKDTAEVTVSVSTDAEIHSLPPEGAKSESRRAKTTKVYQDTWKKTPEGWQMIQRIVD